MILKWQSVQLTFSFFSYTSFLKIFPYISLDFSIWSWHSVQSEIDFLFFILIDCCIFSVLQREFFSRDEGETGEDLTESDCDIKWHVLHVLVSVSKCFSPSILA